MNDVLLFTCGLDSFLANDLLIQNPHFQQLHRVYFNVHSRYSEYEIDFLKKWYPSSCVDIIDILDLEKYEKPDAYLPNRNLMLLTLAQSIYDADFIWLNGTRDDRVSDNNTEFREAAERVLSISSGKNVSIKSVLDKVEKTEAVKEYCDFHKNPEKTLELLSKTFSCYSEDLYEDQDLQYFKKTNNGYEEIGKTNVYGCMECPACFRRMCALTAANLYVPFYDFPLVKKYRFDDNLDEKMYPNRVKSIKDYYEFMEYCGCD
jgi:7-cyano-7-deazaguanine synthase in queuosine biosynthesis